MFSDEFVNMESNNAILTSLIDVLTSVHFPSFLTLPVSDYRYIPDLSAMCQKPFFSWKHPLDPVPDDIIQLACLDLFDGGLCHRDAIEKGHAALGIPFEPPRGIIKPEFEIPKLHYIPAVSHPNLDPSVDPTPFEPLDAEAAPIARLKKLANSCNDDELETFLIQGAKLANLGSLDPKQILKIIARKVLS
jgi:hypothetical protein